MFALILALVSGPAPAPVAKSFREVESKVGQKVVLRLDQDSPEGMQRVAGSWKASPGIDLETFESDTVGCVWGTEAGEYRVEYQATFARVIEIDQGGEKVRVAVLPFVQRSQTWTVVFQGRGPPKTEEPETPDVDPDAKRRIVIIYETADGVPIQFERARQALKAKGHTLQLVDQDAETGEGNTPKHFQAAAIAAKKVGVPALVVLINEQVLRTVKLPGTSDEIVAEALK